MIQKSDATGSMPQAAKSESGNTSAPEKPASPSSAAQQSMFIAMTLTMSWQLALVVVVPIVGGHFLDEHYHLTPWLTLAGLGVAMIGVFGVLTRMVSEANRRMGNDQPGGNV